MDTDPAVAPEQYGQLDPDPDPKKPDPASMGRTRKVRNYFQFDRNDFFIMPRPERGDK